MNRVLFRESVLSSMFLLVTLTLGAAPEESGFTPLFPKDGVPEGWTVRRWDDVSQPADEATVWRVEDGVLHGSDPRGTWLVSDKEYGDFELRFEWKIPERGNGGLGLRFPSKGDPAFDGLELQMVDPRYYGDAASEIPPTELTGGLYRAVAASQQHYRPGEWNEYVITLKGPLVTVTLNGETIQKVNLDEETIPVTRHDGSSAVPLKARPRKGRIGFQELSRGGGHVMIRNARIKELPSEPRP
ncbi:MAG: DUF1080 domain-containing protein [Planctomycetota bacterium]|nr:DUF1080 domain-containing protein [Planctomycetaceae bacterium]MDQ3331330.1 DUF1080 domain-containing protein [Planctomycetota bacterium]